MREGAKPTAHPYGVRAAPVRRYCGSNPGRDEDVATIAAVRAAWIRATEASNIRGLIALAIDDIVVVHGIGINALRTDLAHDFGIFDIEPRD